jgi:hypothetical protein
MPPDSCKFCENFETVLKVQNCEVKKDGNLHIANSAYNLCKLPKGGWNIQ